MNKLSFFKKFKFSFLLLLFTLISPHIFALSGSTTLFASDSQTLTIGTWNLIWPLSDYQIKFYAIPSLEGSNSLSWYTDRDLLSPDERLSLNVNLENGKYSFHIDFRVVGIKKSNGETIFDKNVGIDLGTQDVPSSWSTPSLTVPIIPLEEFGVPAELSILFSFSFSTRYFISLSTYGLEPQSTIIEFIESGSKTLDFNKLSGVGSDLGITSSTVEAQGSITVSAGLSVFGVPTPLKINFATVPISDWSISSLQDFSLATLKTPVEATFSLSSSLINFGESVKIRGELSPAAEGVHVQLLIDETVIETTQSKNDGSFKFTWNPSFPSTFSVSVKSLESKYTTASTSQTFQLKVNKPPESLFKFSPDNPKVGKDVQFTDLSTDLDGQIEKWLWDFGDGSTTNEKNPIHTYSSEGDYTVKLSVTDNNNAQDSSQKKISISKALTSISITLSESKILLDDSITVSGSIDPPITEVTVFIDYSKPDGSKISRTVLTDSNGYFSDLCSPSEIGTWNVKVSWEGNIMYNGDTSPIQEFIVEQTQESSPSEKETTTQEEQVTPEPTYEEPLIEEKRTGFDFRIQLEWLIIGLLAGVIIVLALKRK